MKRKMRTFVFVSTQGAGRPQMATAFFNQLADSRTATAICAGLDAAEQVYPEVVQVMREVGIDLSRAAPRKLTQEMLDGAEMLITLGGADCPAPAGVKREEWPLPELNGQGLRAVRGIRQEIEERVRGLLGERGLLEDEAGSF